MMCDMYYGCPSWCYNGWNYPYQALPSVNDKSDSKGKWWYGNGYGMMGHGMMRECMMCDMYYGCPSWCNNGWNYPYQTLPAVSDKSETKAASKWYGNGYGMMGHGMMEDCMMCDMYHGCPSWCYNGWNYPYQASVVISEKSDNKDAAQPAAKAESNGKWMYPYGYGYQRQCMVCDMSYGCPSWCWNNGWNNGWNYPYQALPSVNDKSDSKGKWWYGNGYGMMGHGMMRDCMMCDMYYGCPSWCWNNGWNN